VDVAFDAYLFEESGEGFAPGSGSVLRVRVPGREGVFTRLIDHRGSYVVGDRTGKLRASLGRSEFDVPRLCLRDFDTLNRPHSIL